MSLVRLQILALILIFGGCAAPTTPAPTAFGLSIKSLRQRYAATRTIGTVQLFGQSIVTTTDENGRDAHLASGGALLVKKSVPLIHAQAPSILVTADFAEVRGKATVQKGDQLFIGKTDATKFIIDGVVIKPDGPYETHAVADTGRAPAPEEIAPPVVPMETKRSATDRSQESRKRAQESSSKPKAKPAQSASEPASAPSSPRSQAVSPEERARLLNLMRAPKAD